MKPLRLATLLVVLSCTLASPALAQWDHFKGLDGAPAAGAGASDGIRPEVIITAQAHAYARALADLKLEGVELTYADPQDEKAVEVNLAKQRMIIREMAELTVLHLRKRREELADTYKAGHPKMVEIDAEIARRLKLAGVR